MQRSRRTNPYPLTWEIPLAVMVGVLLVLVVGVQLGRSVANLLAGNSWVLVGRPRLFSSLPGVLTGHAGAGLTGIGHPSGPGMLFGSVVVVELACWSGACSGCGGGGSGGGRLGCEGWRLPPRPRPCWVGPGCASTPR